MNCNEIVRTIGIDVHKDSYSLSTFNPKSGLFVAECTTSADPKSVVAYVDRLRKEMGIPVSIEVGYEAGPTGFGLKRSLEKAPASDVMSWLLRVCLVKTLWRKKSSEFQKKIVKRRNLGPLDDLENQSCFLTTLTNCLPFIGEHESRQSFFPVSTRWP